MKSTLSYSTSTYKASAVLAGSKDAQSGTPKIAADLLKVFKNIRGLQRRILSVLAGAGRSMYLREIAELLKADKRRVHDSLKRLVSRGLVERLSGGRYQVKPELRHVVLSYLAGKLSGGRRGSKDAQGTGVPAHGSGSRYSTSSACGHGRGSGSGVSVRLDNVRGYLFVGSGYRYYNGDRFGDRGPEFLGYLDRVSYFEVGLLFRAESRNECFIAVYFDARRGVVKVEFRPYRNDPDVRRGDWRSVLRRGVLDLLRWALRALKAVVRELGVGMLSDAAGIMAHELGPVLRSMVCGPP